MARMFLIIFSGNRIKGSGHEVFENLIPLRKYRVR
jgi:hypothetical protein